MQRRWKIGPRRWCAGRRATTILTLPTAAAATPASTTPTAFLALFRDLRRLALRDAVGGRARTLDFDWLQVGKSGADFGRRWRLWRCNFELTIFELRHR
jgi:hypothetical protein